jgi:hypothetical protein
MEAGHKAMSIGRGPGVRARLVAVAAHSGGFRVVSGRTGPGQSSSRLRSLAKERRRRCLQAPAFFLRRPKRFPC